MYYFLYNSIALSSYGTQVREVEHNPAARGLCSSSTSSGSGSTSPSSSRTPKKRVQFSQDVKDNEMTSEKLIYEKLPLTTSPRKPSVVIDIEKLNAEQGFGFNKYLSPSDSSATDNYHEQIFESPYFDYRRTHSRVSSYCVFIVFNHNRWRHFEISP